MSIKILATILGLSGQRVNEIALNKHLKAVHIICQRINVDKAIDSLTAQRGTIMIRQNCLVLTYLYIEV